MGGRGGIASEALRVFDQVNIFTLGGGIQEAKVRIPIVAPRQFVNLIPVQSRMW